MTSASWTGWIAVTPSAESLASSLTAVLGWSLIHFLWQGAVIAAALAVALGVIRRSSASIRYATAVCAFLLMAVCPLATSLWIAGSLPMTPNPASLARQFAAAPPANEAVPVTQTVGDEPDRDNAVPEQVERAVAVWPSRFPPETDEASISDHTSFVQPVLAWVVAIWCLGVLALSARLCGGWWNMQRMRHLATRPLSPGWDETFVRLVGRMRVRFPVRALESLWAEVPAVVGWLRPVILIPSSALVGLTPRQLEAILAHELAHVRRHDYLVNLLQTAIETLLFYHPAVWWVSRLIRAEREVCCDEIAVSVCGDRLEYARALTALEEQRGRTTRLAVAASGGSLLERIRRLLGGPASQANRSAWLVVAAIAIVFAGALSLRNWTVSVAEATEEDQTMESFGAESAGLRFRLIAVESSTDDEHPDAAKAASEFASAEDVTLAVELKNVSAQPQTLLGVRYGDSYPTAAGKLNTGFFAPHLFELEVTDADGQPLPRPARTFERDLMIASGMSAHQIAPGESLKLVLRPASFLAPMQHQLGPGSYRVTVRYRGPTEETLAQIRKHWPDHAQAKAWPHEVRSNTVAFTVGNDPAAPKPPRLIWGPEHDGLQAALELRVPKRVTGQVSDPPGIPTKTNVAAIFHVKNVSDKPITFASETGRQGDTIEVRTETGENVAVQSPFFTGVPIMVRWRLKPGEIAELSALASGLGWIEQPGIYLVRFTIRMNSMQSKDDKGNITFPLKDDWQSELTTGTTPLVLRQRTPRDDENEKPPRFVGRIEFVGQGGEPVESGTFTIRGEIQRDDHKNRPIRRGANEIPEATAREAYVSVRAPGFEEAYFHDVKLKPDAVTRVTLTPAAPVRVRFVTADEKPLAGVRVRYFNKNSAKASSGPFPMDGIQGPIWATSAADGRVVLDTLQRVDPYYKKLGDAIYFFYVEPPEELVDDIAPKFLGPVRAGQDMGDVMLGEFVEVSGEIRGTPKELANFAAEWDQPFEMKTDAPDSAWSYAVSKRLDTLGDDGKLLFRLPRLRPGKLRIIANFSPPPHSVSHTYGRRDPKGTDVVFEFDAKKSLSGVILEPKGRKTSSASKLPVKMYSSTRTSDRWITVEDGSQVAVDEGLDWEGKRIYLSLTSDLVVTDAIWREAKRLRAGVESKDRATSGER